MFFLYFLPIKLATDHAFALQYCWVRALNPHKYLKMYELSSSLLVMRCSTIHHTLLVYIFMYIYIFNISSLPPRWQIPGTAPNYFNFMQCETHLNIVINYLWLVKQQTFLFLLHSKPDSKPQPTHLRPLSLIFESANFIVRR